MILFLKHQKTTYKYNLCSHFGVPLKMDNEDLDYFEKCEILNLNPVLTARHFQYREEVFFKEILLHKKSPIGQVNNYLCY